MDNFKWIKDFLKDKRTHSGLKDLIPDCFDRYLLVGSSVGIIDDFPFSDYPENNQTIEDLNKQHAIQREFGIFLNPNADEKYRKTTLKEIAKRFNVRYCIDTLDLLKPTPGTTTLFEPTQRKWTELLRTLQTDSELYLYIEDSFRFQGIYNDWNFKEENILQDIADYLRIQQQTGWDSTSFLFSKDLKWCLVTVEDFRHLIWCVDNSTYATLKKMESLEMFEINYDFVLDSRRPR